MGLLDMFKKKKAEVNLIVNPAPKARTEKLECTCKSVTNHREYVDSNSEVIVECTKCKRFIKFPA